LKDWHDSWKLSWEEGCRVSCWDGCVDIWHEGWAYSWTVGRPDGCSISKNKIQSHIHKHSLHVNSFKKKTIINLNSFLKIKLIIIIKQIKINISRH
jgi:hypothetical protein